MLVAVSGGPDSVALLCALLDLKKKSRLKLRVLHLNHMIRQDAARRDAEFVKRLAKRFNLGFTIKSVDVARLAEAEGISLEDAGRQARYKFFISAAKRYGFNKIATAHTKDDRAETALMRILKGTGLAGISGISPCWKIDGISIVRPMLDMSKDEVINFLKKRRVRYRQDATNRSSVYYRNRVRNELLPLLAKRFNPNITDALANLSEIAMRDYDFLSQTARKLYSRYREKVSSNEVSLNMRKFSGEHIAMQAAMARLAIEELKGDLGQITYIHWRAIYEMAGGEGGTKMLDLPDGVTVAREYDRLVFYKGGNRKIPDIFVLKVPGKTAIKKLGIRVDAEIRTRRRFFNTDRYEENFDYGKLRFPLMLRARAPGDRIKPLGMKGEKKLKDLFIDEKIPLRQRGRVPVILSGRDIIWVAGVRMSEDFKVDRRTRKILKIRVEKGT